MNVRTYFSLRVATLLKTLNCLGSWKCVYPAPALAQEHSGRFDTRQAALKLVPKFRIPIWRQNIHRRCLHHRRHYVRRSTCRVFAKFYAENPDFVGWYKFTEFTDVHWTSWPCFPSPARGQCGLGRWWQGLDRTNN